MHIFPIGKAFPYVENAKNYLMAGKGANVADFFTFMHNPNAPITVKWEKIDGADRYEIELIAPQYESEPTVVPCSAEVAELALFNLYKGAEYTVRITAYQGQVAIESGISAFQTTSLGPRVMKVDGIYNVRDLGGYKTACGKRTHQGLLYRGGALSPADVYDSQLTEAGKATMKNTMKIKTEIELRHPDETGILENSLIPGAEMIRIVVGPYDVAFSDRAEGKYAYRTFFSTLARQENYPIYFHCTGGADRTGTLSFLLNALLGVSEEILIQDYEFTSFSIYHMRNTQSGVYKDYFEKFRNLLESYDGSTLQEKTERYLLSIGVTEKEIEAIKEIML